MAEGVRFTDLDVEGTLDESDGLFIGSNGTASVKRTTLRDLMLWMFGGKTLLNKLYPVGTVYMTIGNTNPSEQFGGTWELIKDVVLIGAGGAYAVGSSGGSNSVTLNVANLPPHNHAGASHRHTVYEHKHKMGNHNHAVTAANATVVVKSGGEHQHHARYTKDASSGSAKTRYFPGAKTLPPEMFTEKDGSHSHLTDAHTHVMTCSMSGNTVYTDVAGSGYTGYEGNGNTGSTGSGTAFSVMQRYTAVYIWKRTA